MTSVEQKMNIFEEHAHTKISDDFKTLQYSA